MVTDLPDPVVPAIRACGMRATFWKTALPVMSLPRATKRGCGESVYSGEAKREARPIEGLVSFGTSIPTSDFPGIGASIRMGEAARASSRLFCKPTIFDIRTPSAGFNAY